MDREDTVETCSSSNLGVSIGIYPTFNERQCP